MLKRRKKDKDFKATCEGMIKNEKQIRYLSYLQAIRYRSL